MPVITYQDEQYVSKADESVLDTLLRHQINIPYSCNAGVCHCCIMVSDSIKHPCPANLGLRDTLIAQGYFLACQCKPTDAITVKHADEYDIFADALVIEKNMLSDTVCQLKLHSAIDLYYRAGQYINIRMPNGQIRSYSLASLPSYDDYIELHIKRMSNGEVSHWLCDDVKQGDTVEIQGAFGDCFYLTHHVDRDIVMIATGTGLAPLMGIIRDALAHGHQGNIQLYHGDRDRQDLYLDDELQAMAEQYENLEYFPCVSAIEPASDNRFYHGRASDLAFSQNKDLKNCCVYLCGSPAMVKSARQQAYLNGADMKNIYADPFITKELRQTDSTTDMRRRSSD
ncbi:MAG: oxygenase [Gammaproteobacteria bacterium]|nr:MAG: oxygenase [Gammaproteobacteria bacterium]